MNSETFVEILITILSIVIVFVFGWALYQQQQVDSAAVNQEQNPYCKRKVCETSDPQREAYHQINYCLMNSPPQEVADAIDKGCRNTTGSKEIFSEFMRVFSQDVLPYCSYQWGDTFTTTAPGPIDPDVDPNGPVLNGSNNDLILSTLSCATVLGLTSDPSYAIIASYR